MHLCPPLLFLPRANKSTAPHALSGVSLAGPLLPASFLLPSCVSGRTTPTTELPRPRPTYAWCLPSCYPPPSSRLPPSSDCRKTARARCWRSLCVTIQPQRMLAAPLARKYSGGRPTRPSRASRSPLHRLARSCDRRPCAHRVHRARALLVCVYRDAGSTPRKSRTSAARA